MRLEMEDGTFVPDTILKITYYMCDDDGWTYRTDEVTVVFSRGTGKLLYF